MSSRAKGVDPALAARIATAAYAAAFAFFQPSPEWDMQELEAIDLSTHDDHACAQLWTRPDYLTAKVVYDPARMDDTAHVWHTIGHEVAHLLLSEYDALQCGVSGQLDRALTHANERTVTRLERLFKRERPYPGDEAFKEPTP